MKDAIEFTDAQLLAFLDEQLGAEWSSRLEEALREQPELRERLRILRDQNIAGLHTIGSIWRRERLSCPDRDTLGQFLMGGLPDEQADYIRFHLRDIQCRVCNANVDDLNQKMLGPSDTDARRRRLFQTSAGHLR